MKRSSGGRVQYIARVSVGVDPASLAPKCVSSPLDINNISSRVLIADDLIYGGVENIDLDSPKSTLSPMFHFLLYGFSCRQIREFDKGSRI